MPRKRRNLKAGYSYHITTRCNNHEFKLARRECREVFLYAVKKALDKYKFKLYALCIMSNHVHYLIEPAQPDDLPKIMHFLNWYTAIAVLMQVRYRLTPPPAPPRHGEGSKTPVPPSLVGKGARGLGLGIPHLTENRYMCFNRMLRRTGHFWEKRYFCDGFPASDRERALNTLRYIHGNPKAAKMRHGFFYDFSNYGSYERLTNDGLTHWHPAFLRLGSSLEECARKYKGFCQKYKPA